jgi:uncharacterized protein YuzE
METAKVMKILEQGNALTWEYDEEADVLYVSVGKPTKAIGVDVGDSTVVRYDEKKAAVVGITLMGFRKRLMLGVGVRRHSPTRRRHGGIPRLPVKV